MIVHLAHGIVWHMGVWKVRERLAETVGRRLWRRAGVSEEGGNDPHAPTYARRHRTPSASKKYEPKLKAERLLLVLLPEQRDVRIDHEQRDVAVRTRRVDTGSARRAGSDKWRAMWRKMLCRS